ncbi:MAG: HAD family phosphatase [Phycisphaerae bacterium]
MQLGVIFDMDGVLIASGPAHAGSWRVVARKHGISVSDVQFKALFGRTSRDIVRELWGHGVSDDEIRRIDDEKEAVYRALISGVIPLTIGTRELLTTLSDAGLLLAIASSGPAENLDLVLTETRIGSFFRAVVGGFDVPHGKPAPDCCLLAASRIGLSPGNCVVVEDAPAGIRAGLAAGMAVIGLVGTHPADSLHAAGATRVVTELRAITPELIRELATSPQA